MEEKTLYQKLCEAVDNLPKEAVESAKKEATRKGYDTTGYQYQFLVNVLNETVGIGGWKMTYEIVKEMEGQYSNGKGFYDITANVTVDILGSAFSMPGGHISSMYSDALKGAVTNGFKKTLSFFSVGKKAYEGTLDDDYKPLPEGWDTPKSPTKPQGETKLYGLKKSEKSAIKPTERKLEGIPEDVPMFPEDNTELNDQIFRLLDKHGISGNATKTKYFVELCGLEPTQSQIQDVIDNWIDVFPKVLNKLGGKK